MARQIMVKAQNESLRAYLRGRGYGSADARAFERIDSGGAVGGHRQ